MYKNSLRKKFQEVYERNKEILKVYSEGISDLKKYELHPVLKKEGKKHLIDIYYDEQQMNKWRDSCIRSNESAKMKFEKADKDFSMARVKLAEKRSSSDIYSDESRYKELNHKIQAMMNDVEPLIMSIISTAYDDLKSIHDNLNTFCKSDP